MNSALMPYPRNKTIATWLALMGGPLGLHRFYLHGFRDLLGWLLPLPTALGLYGIARAQQLGLDDHLSWALIPLLGFTFSGCALTAIIYGLSERTAWNKRFNPSLPVHVSAGGTLWMTILGVGLSLMLGSTALMASLAYSFQHYFEYQVNEARKISQ